MFGRSDPTSAPDASAAAERFDADVAVAAAPELGRYRAAARAVERERQIGGETTAERPERDIAGRARRQLDLDIAAEGADVDRLTRLPPHLVQSHPR